MSVPMKRKFKQKFFDYFSITKCVNLFSYNKKVCDVWRCAGKALLNAVIARDPTFFTVS